MDTSVAISMDSLVTVAPDQVHSDLGGEAVILDLAGGVYHGLNATGTHVWNVIQRPASVRQIHQSLLEAYDVEPDECQRDLLELLSDMAAKGLVIIR